LFPFEQLQTNKGAYVSVKGYLEKPITKTGLLIMYCLFWIRFWRFPRNCWYR